VPGYQRCGLFGTGKIGTGDSFQGDDVELRFTSAYEPTDLTREMKEIEWDVGRMYGGENTSADFDLPRKKEPTDMSHDADNGRSNSESQPKRSMPCKPTKA